MASGVTRSSKFFAGCQARKIFFQTVVGGEAQPRWRPAAKIGKAGVRADALHFFERRAGAIGRADQRADAGARNGIDVNARVAKNAQHADVRDAAREASGQSKADFAARGNTVRRFGGGGRRLVFVVLPAANYAGDDWVAHTADSLDANEVCVSSIDPCMLVL